MKTILMTGAAGRIGTFLRPELAGKYQLRLSDLKPIRDLRPGETFVRADISKLSDMLRVTKGMDAVVHFGGQSGEHDWQHILSATSSASTTRSRRPAGTGSSAFSSRHRIMPSASTAATRP